MKNNYDIIVVGSGHAGVEAAHIADKLGLSVALISFSKNDIAFLPCNISIGGSAKGIIVKEIFALGGLMPLAADETQTQTKILNKSKGPAVWALRTQVDKVQYPKYISNYLDKETNIDFLEEEVVSLILEKEVVSGVYLKSGKKINSKKVILATGTFLNSKTMKGSEIILEGPDGKKTNTSISKQLKDFDFKLKRLKTGTPPRLKKDSIDFSKMEIEAGSDSPIYFTEDKKINKEFENIPAYLSYTNLKTHEVIENNIEKSYLYSEEIKGEGPRYCPSIEDKVKRFNDKERHQIFLEIESKELNSVYLSGFSSSMPKDVQGKMIKSIEGFEKAEFIKYAYAIEYDSIDPTHLKQTLESKMINNLYFAGQVNGTSGYEEAAAQGLIAGVNAVNAILKKEPLIIDRDEGYIGVMIDDITTKGINDPYRVLSSRAEYRLLLRMDNAVERLHNKAFENKLITKKEFEKIENRIKIINKLKKELWNIRFKKNDKRFLDLLNSKNIDISVASIPAIDIIKRTEFNIDELNEIISDQNEIFKNLTQLEKQKLNIEIKFEGYIKKQERDVLKYKRLQGLVLGDKFNYSDVDNLAIEAREKLEKFQPHTVYQATRISGVNPSDIMVLINFLNKKDEKNNRKI